MTGREVERALLAAARARRTSQFFEEHRAIDLLLDARATGRPAERVLGAYVLDDAHRRGAHASSRRAVVLATGGAGKVYLYTTNPDVATGDGVAMAYRAGAAVANMEFIQFHPTCLYHPDAKNFLISEALRGEGGILRNKTGERVHGALRPAQGAGAARHGGARDRQRDQAHAATTASSST